MDARDLAVDLGDARESDIVRLVADWMDRAMRAEPLDLRAEPPLDGRSDIDALVAAATAHVARQRSMTTPSWAIGAHRCPSMFR